MYPHLRKGDFVTVAKTLFQDLSVGNIVVFKGDLNYVAHRIIKVIKTSEGFKLITKGDSCNKADAPVPEDRYLGKIIAFERKEKKTDLETSFYKKYSVFLAFISPYTAIVYSFVRFFKHLFRN